MRQVDWKRKQAGGRTVVKNGERGEPDGGWVERSFLLVGGQPWSRFFLALTSGLPLETSKHAHSTWLFFCSLNSSVTMRATFRDKSVWYVSALC